MRSSPDATFDAQLESECEHASASAATDDFVEAIASQVERRPPVFTHH